ncbi:MULTISPECIES: phosphoribosyltransferase family protein [Kitasatospora]|uniref:Putative peptidase S09 family protein n=1 Tax=Kitasatospora setae (strain ATCC 33774 / DSM 43861 / JCM 3304 / KCC A-0304 / NBRC 14216 / KM-6054) TaxID=452652 RepID=E4N1B4_KITSK|nr:MULTISPECIES: phosphoribosyltransferase family protein [Kitasatospora]BAJ31948.1 putative peptidase S09 family protein [Kitasatospora setae KM-6054]
MRFTDRTDAGRRLAEALTRADPGLRGAVVVGLPRGGVPVAAVVAAALGTELDVCVVRKLGVPGQPEVAMGAVGEDGARVVNQRVVDAAAVPPEAFAAVEARERAELARRAAVYRGGREPVPLAGRTVLVVDDGVATGASARAACRIVRARGAARVVLAVPVAPPGWAALLADAADAYVAVRTPAGFRAVGESYRDFRQVPDAGVLAALERPAAGAAPETVRYEPASASGPAVLEVPELPSGVVVFAPGDGAGHPAVAARLHRERLATVRFGPSAPGGDAAERREVSGPGPAGGRLAAATRAVLRHPALAGLSYGWFGAGSGAAAALGAAAGPDAPGGGPAAIVACGVRPESAAVRLSSVTAPTLLVAGGANPEVVEWNRRARAELGGESALRIVPGAGQLFEEPGGWEAVAELAAGWFARRLPGRSGGERAER